MANKMTKQVQSASRFDSTSWRNSRPFSGSTVSINAITQSTMTVHRHLLLPLLLVALQTCLASSEEAECTSTSAPYSGVDVSYPIHSLHTIEDNPLGDKATWYDNLINGCRESCERCKAACDQTERDRISMNRRQPQSMVNYTDFGIKKIRVSRVDL